MEQEALRALGQERAARWKGSGRGSTRLWTARLRSDERALGALARRLTPRRGDCSGVDWLLDNRHLAREGLRQSVRALRRVRRLPMLSAPGGLFRLQAAAELLREQQCTKSGDITALLCGIQSANPLEEAELTLFPAALTAAYAAQLRRTGEALEQALTDGADTAALSEQLAAEVRSLAALGEQDWGETLERLSRVDTLFRQDPVYPKMDPCSRACYRQRLVKLARREHLSESDCAGRVLELAHAQDAHIGTLLFTRPLGRAPRPRHTGWYVSLLLALTTALSIAIGFALGRWWAIGLFLLPVSELVKHTVDMVLLRLVRPRPVFRLELKNGVPPEGKTLCVIAALLSDEAGAEELCTKLERCYLANRRAGEQVQYGLLADFPDRTRDMDEADAALLAHTCALLDRLTARYGRRFCLLFRRPTLSVPDGVYRGRERKRGAILSLAGYLRGRRGELELRFGAPEALRDTQFLLVLDSDTILTMDAVTELAGTMLHPLNTPVVDPRRKCVTAGYGILQPRVETELSRAGRSTFARLFSGIAGLDPYGGAVSDLYHDLFDQATFVGKGLLHIDAFLTCMQGRLPENRILSHDLLEGSYLRCGWVSRTELLDSFPTGALSWLSRYHRWIRGDWQILRWLRSRVPNENGERVENPIPLLARWKIFDNLRRSLVPPATLIALLAGLLGTGPLFLTALLAALLTALAQILTAAVELLCRRGQGSFRRYHAGIYAGFTGSILRAGAELLFLPVQSWTAAHAAVLALWRLCVGHRHLLDWVTSGQSSRDGQGFGRYLRRFRPSVCAGAVVLIASPFWAGRLLGLGWTLSPLLFCRWGQTDRPGETLPQRERAFLLHEAALIWRYYRDWLRPEYHYLIPDNVQSMPDQGAAERTSPTNLGLSLLSPLSALDLNLTGRAEAVDLIDRQLTAIEGLERWHGHLYNWYDLTTARPLTPRYVSTVDSGNLCACLITLSAGLDALGEGELSRRAAALARAMDFSLLYDPRRGLFYIGYDREQGSYSPSHYDLLASEARTTSYLAIARNEVPPRHWRHLSRSLVRRHRYTGMASWSGTMFEYLMPRLFLPVCPDSLLGETLTFCVDEQRRAGEGPVWGVSESGYYELDLGQSYQYKAHGIPSLTVKRERTAERVIAPYAAFLALSVAPRAAAVNLRRLRDMGAEGMYGLYEALDCTPARGGSAQNPLLVRSWMAHHLGMSLLAVDNCLNDDVMVHRFWSDVEMRSAEELLMEKIPVGDAVARVKPTLRIPTPQGKKTLWHRTGTGFDPSDPVCTIAANESYSVTLTAGGAGESRTGPWTILHPDGMEIALRQGEDTTTIFPCTGGGSELRWRFTSGGAELKRTTSAYTLTEQLTVDADHSGEIRTVTLTAHADLTGTLCLLLRPVLDLWDSFTAHPAFSRMQVETGFVGNGVQFRRRPGRGRLAPVLTLLWTPELGWSTNREDYLTTRLSHPNRVGAVLDPCAALELPVRLGAGEAVTVKLALAVGGETDSLIAAQALLALRRPKRSALTDRLAGRYGAGTVRTAFALLARLRAPGQLGGEGRVEGQRALWPFALSGDLPIVTCLVQKGELADCLRLGAVHDTLRQLGTAFDLVYLLPEQGDYLTPLRDRLRRALAERGWGHLLERAGGIHLLTGAEADWQPVLGMAALNLRPGDSLTQPDRFQTPAAFPKCRQYDRAPVWAVQRRGFTLEVDGALPPVRWSQMLVNDRFGWRCDEAGTGHLWLQNAHMGQLTPWTNDPTALTGAETLTLYHDGAAHCLFARPGEAVRVTYGPGYARWEHRIGDISCTLTAFVPLSQAVRVWKIDLTGAAAGDTLRWTLLPQLSQQARHRPWVRMQPLLRGAALENPAGTLPGVVLELLGSTDAIDVHWQGRAELTFPARSVLLTAGVRGHYQSVNDAEALLTDTYRWWSARTAALRVNTPDEALNHYLSFWGPYQVLAGRVLGRNGLYQCGGAVGFRDQLQDVLALLPFAPEVARRQILTCAAHQFREGDVLHWWHPEGNQGVRTRISDDLLWLPYALCRWREELGDTTLLREPVPYLEGAALREDEPERYDRWQTGTDTDTVYRHAVQAAECVLNRGLGAHGLCLMGTGDWNDGLNRLGARGRGESVWLTWFLSVVLARFAPLCAEQGEEQRAARYETLSQKLAESADRAWNGAWYLRAYDDAGVALGEQGGAECAIDSIAQSFAVFALGDTKRTRAAVGAAVDLLYNRERRLVRLLWPPFRGARDAGYLQSYPAGLRENGGQYTHAACWLALALLRLGESDTGYAILRDLLPERHPTKTYRAEPYVLAGDVYAAEGQQGRGGWSWYTGAAGWYCQCALRELLGLRLREGRLYLHPRLPSHWPGYQASWTAPDWTLSITVERGDTPGLTLDGTPCEGGVDLAGLRGAHELRLFLKK